MRKSSNVITKAIGYAIIAFLLVNLVYFLIGLNEIDSAQSWKIVFKHGVFSINEKLTGLKLWSPKAISIMLIAFITTLFLEYRKGNLSQSIN